MSTSDWNLWRTVNNFRNALVSAFANVQAGPPSYKYDERNIAKLVVDAINAGGDAHTDINGVRYRRDPLTGDRNTVDSDFGRRMSVQKVPPVDAILYQTERYSLSDFEYEMNVPLRDGDYVLVLKFCEVYFNEPEKKIFDVVVNDEHTVISELDIFRSAGGRSVAHDERIPFQIKGKHLIINGVESDYTGPNLRVRFVRGSADNPKINAMYIIRGGLLDVPDLGVLVNEPASDEMPEQAEQVEEPVRADVASGPALDNPYEEMDAAQMLLPVLLSLAAFFPVLYCLCKL